MMIVAATRVPAAVHVEARDDQRDDHQRDHGGGQREQAGERHRGLADEHFQREELDDDVDDPEQQRRLDERRRADREVGAGRRCRSAGPPRSPPATSRAGSPSVAAREEVTTGAVAGRPSLPGLVGPAMRAGDRRRDGGAEQVAAAARVEGECRSGRRPGERAPRAGRIQPERSGAGRPRLRCGTPHSRRRRPSGAGGRGGRGRDGRDGVRRARAVVAEAWVSSVLSE